MFLNNNQHNQQEFAEAESFDYQKIFYQIIKNWYVFAMALLFALLAAKFIIQYSTPQYQVSSSILMHNEQNSLQQEVLELDKLSKGNADVENELSILRSRSLLALTIEQLDYDVFYYLNTRFGYREIYQSAPFHIKLIDSEHHVVNTKCHLKYISPNRVILFSDVKNAAIFSPLVNRIVDHKNEFEYSDTVNIGDTVTGIFGKFHIKPNLNSLSSNTFQKDYAFQFNTTAYLKNKFDNFSYHLKQNSSHVTVKLSGENPRRLIEFLNTHLQLYLRKGVEKKNRTAQATIEFINKQLKQVADSLAVSEDELERFQATNKLLHFDYKAHQIYGNIESLQKEYQDIQLKLQYYKYLKDYIQSNETPTDIVAPSSMNIHDPLLSSFITQLTELTAERKEMMYNAKKTNPYISNINRKIDDVKNALIENLESAIKTSSITLAQLDEQITKSNSQVTELPGEQRKLMAMQRDFEINNELYNFLLKKRSEMQIAKASNLPSNEIIDKASLESVTQTAPDERQIYVISLVLALLLPGACIYLKDIWNNRITDRGDITRITTYPIIGQIFHHKLQTQEIFNDQSSSHIRDAFRYIRTNFQFFEKKDTANVIQITSSITREGKSFVSLNLAEAFALNKKRTVLVDFDLRKAKINEYANLKSAKGLSMLLSGHGSNDAHIEKTDNPYLDIIPAGPIPPNPTELIESEYTAGLMDYLRQHYQYILIDTPPISSISDAYIITRYTHVNLFVVRNNYTPKKLFETIIRDIQVRQIPIHIIINDIQMHNSKYYGYYRPYRYEPEQRSYKQKLKRWVSYKH